MNKQNPDNYREQTAIDVFYMKNGDCCAGCDYWRHDGSIIGECINSKIIPAEERLSLLGLEGVSLKIGAGHALTRREHVCGQFKDTFNWGALPLMYLKKIKFKGDKPDE